ncbi:hypothetical protein [Micromonospora chokoriensis]|uniref:Alkaline shock response membrane anchor protein AmaP n=1 Tax=Micromonospora chokoriensis TaxID=356851 RepID=A0A1C4Y3D8_9ACTN|nr:hypothetical protein [Micromonospora chokoriensis]SCF15106.1 hypothetical protein GA0070612_4237 [Micromonospora chokoriensis]
MTDAAHRLLWTIVALVLVAAGATAMWAGVSAPADDETGAAVLGAGLLDAWRLAAPWSTLAAAATGVLAALAGQRLLAGGLRRPREALRGMLSHHGHRPGRTRLATDVLIGALERDLTTGDHGVRRARVVLTGAPQRPDVWIRVDLAAGVAADGVRAHVDAAVRRFATTAGCAPAHLDVTARMEPGPP